MGVGFKLPLGARLVAVVMLLVLVLVVLVLVVLVVVVLGTRFGKDVSSSMVTSTALVWVSISNGKKVRDKEIKDEVDGRVRGTGKMTGKYENNDDRKLRKY